MSGTIPLTPAEQTRLTVALELENAGFVEAAKWLRERIPALQNVSWDEKTMAFSDPEKWAQLFRVHHGSLPPQAPTHHYGAPPPIPVTPQIRLDQTTAQS